MAGKKKPDLSPKKRRAIPDTKKVVVKTLVDSGLTYRETAEIMGISRGVITKIVQDFESNKEILRWYKKNRADVLAQMQLDNLALQKAIMQTISPEELAGWKPDQRQRWYSAAGIHFGIEFDKERLERGESTGNILETLEIIMQLKREHYKEEREMKEQRLLDAGKA